MDLKTKIEEESIFYKRPHSGSTGIYHLHKKGIYTIEDFINYDSTKLNKKFRLFQNLIRCKYLGEPLVTDVLLEKEYSGDVSNKDFNEKVLSELSFDAKTLGLNIISDIGENIIYNGSSFKMINLIRKLASGYYGISCAKYYENLTDFYIEYYNKKIDDNNAIEQKYNNKKEIEYIEILKEELVNLLNRRNELDRKIAATIEQINFNKSSKVNNARK